MKTSLIIVTYNWKEALRLTLESVLSQSVLPYEILVADDGSADGTGDMIKKISLGCQIPIHYLWQENLGFRAARCRNMAIAAAKGDYIILIDGDVIIEHHFIEDHKNMAQDGYFIQGSRVLLDNRETNRRLQGKRKNISFLSAGIENRKNTLRSSLLSKLFSYVERGISGLKTCNFAFYRVDALAVNGFNEDFVGWGREDSEFAVRMMNRGIKRKNLKFKAIAYHLFHQQAARSHLAGNEELLEAAIRKKLTWCDNGIAAHLQPSLRQNTDQEY